MRKIKCCRRNRKTPACQQGKSNCAPSIVAAKHSDKCCGSQKSTRWTVDRPKWPTGTVWTKNSPQSYQCVKPGGFLNNVFRRKRIEKIPKKMGNHQYQANACLNPAMKNNQFAGRISIAKCLTGAPVSWRNRKFLPDNPIFLFITENCSSFL